MPIAELPETGLLDQEFILAKLSLSRNLGRGILNWSSGLVLNYYSVAGMVESEKLTNPNDWSHPPMKLSALHSHVAYTNLTYTCTLVTNRLD